MRIAQGLKEETYKLTKRNGIDIYQVFYMICFKGFGVYIDTRVGFPCSLSLSLSLKSEMLSEALAAYVLN